MEAIVVCVCVVGGGGGNQGGQSGLEQLERRIDVSDRNLHSFCVCLAADGFWVWVRHRLKTASSSPVMLSITRDLSFFPLHSFTKHLSFFP